MSSSTVAAPYIENHERLYQTISGSLQDLHNGLAAEDQLKYDRIITPGSARMIGGRLVIADDYLMPGDPDSPKIDGEQFGAFTKHARQQLSDMLDIPWAYTQRMFDAEAVDLYDHNVNEWLARRTQPILVRALCTDDGYLVRAILSNKYQAIDDVDVLSAALGGLRDGGVSGTVTGDRTEGKMMVRVLADDLTADISEILRGYTYRGRNAADYPLVRAGLVITNSEVGNGAINVRPEIRIEVCTNGMTVDVAGAAQRYRKIHFGAAIQETGIVKWSDDTRANVLTLVRSQIKDAATTFLSRDFLEASVAELAAFTKIEIVGLDAQTKAVDTVAQRAKFTQAERDLVFAEFMKGNDETVFGVAQAISAAAHTVRTSDPERANVLEEKALVHAGVLA